MLVEIKLGTGEMMFAEMQEFGSFGIEAQRYICQSLDVAFSPDVPAACARKEGECDDACAQKQAYALLKTIRQALPLEDGSVDPENFLFPLIAVSTFDVTCGPITTFAEYRFLYERLLGPKARPWLASAFLAAAATPYLPAEIRQALVRSVNEAFTNRWSEAYPTFWPRWSPELETEAA